MGEAESAVFASSFPLRYLLIGIVALCALLLGAWYFSSQVGDQVAGELSGTPEPVVAPPESAVAPVEPVAPPLAVPVEPPVAPAGAPGAMLAPTATPSDSSAPAVASAPLPTPNGIPNGTPNGLRIEFEGRSWIEIRDVSQRVVFSGEYPGGTRQNIDGKGPFHLWIGKASGVRVFYGERNIDLKPHTREDIARLTVE